MNDKLTDLNSVVSSFPCGKCGKKLGKTFGWLKTHDHFVCVCGARNEWSTDQVVDGINEITKSRAKEIKQLRRAFKR